MTNRLLIKTWFSFLIILAISTDFTKNAEAFYWEDGEWYLEEGEEKLILEPGESVYIPMIYHFIVEGEHKQRWKSLSTGKEFPERDGVSEYANWDGEITGNMGVTILNTSTKPITLLGKLGEYELKRLTPSILTEIDNTELMLKTGITVGMYNFIIFHENQDPLTIRFRDANQVGAWLGALHGSKMFMEGYGTIDTDSFWGKLGKLKGFKGPFEFLVDYGALALFEQDNGYDLVDASIKFPLTNFVEDIPVKLSDIVVKEVAKRNDLQYEELMYKLLSGDLPQIASEIGQALEIDFDKSHEVRSVLKYLLIETGCPNYVLEQAKFICNGKTFAKMPFYGNRQSINMHYTPITDFNSVDLQFSSEHYFPKVGTQNQPEFNEENLKLFILDTYNILTNQKPQTNIQKYVQEAIYAYNGEKSVDWNPKEDVAVDHNWTITFNNQLDETTVNNENFSILYEGKPVTGIHVSLNADRKSVNIEAPKEGYKPGETYSLHISESVKSANNELLNQPNKMDFTIKEVKLATRDELATARYKTVIKDEYGSDYHLYLMPKNENQTAGLYKGNYGFILQKFGSDLGIWQEAEVSDFSFNEDFGVGNVEMVSVIKGKSQSKFDLLVLSERVSANENLLRLYAVHEGKLVKLKIKGDSSDYSIAAVLNPKFISSNMVQNVTYSNRNEDFGWEYGNYRIDIQSGLLIKEGHSMIYNDDNWEEGKMIYERWIEDPDYFVQYESLPSVKWDGEWTRELPFSSGILEIINVQSSTFNFELNVSSGAHVDFLEGTAQIVGNKAYFYAKNTACKLTFTHKGEAIHIEETTDCVGLSTSFGGEFLLEPVPVEESLYPIVIVNKTVNEKFHQLTGTDYQLFYESMQLVSRDLYDDEVNGKVITGAVRGLFTIMEGIIIIGDDGHLYGAVINDGSIHYYTNNPDYKKRLPKSIVTWMEGFNHYDVEYLSK